MASLQIDRITGLGGDVALKAPCRVATTTAITLSGFQTIDTITVVDGDRVLVKNQADTTQNGIYLARTGVWDRALDWDGPRDVVAGTIVYVLRGTNRAFWQADSAADPIIPGTSSITFSNTAGSLAGDMFNMGTDFAANDVGFAAAVAACGSSKILNIPTGVTVNLTTPVALLNSLKIRGKGTISASIGAAANLFDLTNLSDVDIDGPAIVCTRNAQSAYTQAIFLFNTSTRCKIKNCNITGTNINMAAFTGSGATASLEYEIEGNTINCLGSGVYSFGIFCNGRTDTVSITTAGNRGRIVRNDISAQVQDILYDGDGSTISDNHLHGPGVGMSTLKIKDSLICFNRIHDKTGQGLAIGNGTGDLALGVTVANNEVNNCYQGINLYAQPVANANFELNRGISVVGNIVHSNTVNGIFAYGNGHAAITGNSCYGNGGNGIDVETGDPTAASAGHISVTANYTFNNGQNGIAVTGPSGALLTAAVIIANNTSFSNVARGFYIGDLNRPVVMGNIAHSNGTYGFNLTENTKPRYIGNIAYSNTTADWQHTVADTEAVLMGNDFVTSNLDNTAATIGAYGIYSAFGNTGKLQDCMAFGGHATLNVIGQGINFGGDTVAPKIGGVTVVAP